jgi:hypothetical protein
MKQLTGDSSVVSWKSACEEEIIGWCEIAASLGPSYLSVDNSSARAAVTRGSGVGS